jgi:predicted nucleotidyltransferase component of viral defense system
MDQSSAGFLSRKLGIAVEQVVREEIEISILKTLLESRIGHSLVFKGGTALRLAYGSPRFSDDLDFSALAPINEQDFKKVSVAAAKSVPESVLTEALAKYHTLFALYQFRVPYIGRPFSVKIEISMRRESWKQGQDYELKLLSSEVTNLTVLAPVATLIRLDRDKRKAFEARRQPRDLYDLWFISQKLGREFKPDTAGLDPSLLRRDLRKYLPQSHWRLIDRWIG